jgi:hypothetical protein
MTGWFLLMVWLGGTQAMPDRKLGFWNRMLWPVELGEWLHAKALENKP